MEKLSTLARRAHLAGAFFSSIKPIRIRDFFAVMQKKLSTRFVRSSTGSCVASRRSPYANSQSSSTKRNCMESAKSSSTLPTNKCGTPPAEPVLKVPDTHARASSVSSVARSGVCSEMYLFSKVPASSVETFMGMVRPFCGGDQEARRVAEMAILLARENELAIVCQEASRNTGDIASERVNSMPHQAVQQPSKHDPSAPRPSQGLDDSEHKL
jgi:hypothetical protein